MVNPAHRTLSRRSSGSSHKRDRDASLGASDSQTARKEAQRACGFMSPRKLGIDQLMVPSYIRRGPKPKMSRTTNTTRFHILEMDLFMCEPGPSFSTKTGRAQQIELFGCGVSRSMKVPENYSISHLAALMCFTMGWPLDTAFNVWVRGLPRGNGQDPIRRKEPSNTVELWFCLIPNEDEVEHGSYDSSQCQAASSLSNVKLVEVWNPYGLTSNRLQPFTNPPKMLIDSLNVRIRCEAAGLESPSFSVNEPFGISGCGAPPAPVLPLICDRGRELEERWDTKRFDGWAFQYSFWDFVEGRVISEVDVEGVHLWEIDSEEFQNRLGVLQRRIEGDWISDLEEFAIEFESEGPKTVPLPPVQATRN